MALGTPVVATNQPAVEEVIEDAGIVLPRDADAWAGVLDEVALRRQELISAGRRRSGAFTAARSGQALAEAYRRALM